MKLSHHANINYTRSNELKTNTVLASRLFDVADSLSLFYLTFVYLITSSVNLNRSRCLVVLHARART